jgi:Mlc titration factor MtfA (ptsG expression regulator)
MTDGSINGRPALHRGMSADEWRDVCSSAFEDMRNRSGRRRRSQIDSYATVSDAEFFAVMTEYFFELPHVLRREYPEVYRLFAGFYRQEPEPCGSRSRLTV